MLVRCHSLEPALRSRIADWCKESEPSVDCDAVSVEDAPAPGSHTLLLRGRLLVCEDAVGPAGEMVVKREFFRAALVEPFVERHRDAVLEGLTGRVEGKRAFMMVSDPATGASRSVPRPDVLRRIGVVDEQFGLELVKKLASEMAAGATIGHRRGGPSLAHAPRMAYWESQDYGPAEVIPGWRSGLVTHLERGVAECRDRKDRPKELAACVVAHAVSALSALAG